MSRCPTGLLRLGTRKRRELIKAYPVFQPYLTFRSSLPVPHPSSTTAIIITATTTSSSADSLPTLRNIFDSVTRASCLRRRPVPSMATIQRRSSHFKNTHTNSNNDHLSSANKLDDGVRITQLGLYSNLSIAVIKGVGGYAFNSQAMIADAWHSLTDIASDVLTLATVSWSSKPPTPLFPTGYGKIESLGALGVSGMLVIGGGFMCFHSCDILFSYFFLDAAAQAASSSHGHSHASIGGPSIHAAWLALGTIFLKEWLYHATMKVAKQRKSSVLASNAIHHRIDSLTGAVTLFAILGANLLERATWLDPIGGLFISLLVIKGGWGNTISALNELADKGIEEEIKESIRKHVHEAFEEICNGSQVELVGVGGVKSGPNYLIDLQLAVPPFWTIDDLSKVEDGVRQTVGSKFRGLQRIRIRFVSKESQTDFYDEFTPSSLHQNLEKNKVYTDKNTDDI